MRPPCPTIAIDGPSASGKGTIARRLAAHFGFAHLDTGLLYRAVGLAVLKKGGDPANAVAAETAAKELTSSNIESVLADPALRDDRTAAAASKVAALLGVRAALLDFQQSFCAHPPHNRPGAVLDGRDIGTVIAPQALVKIYIIASIEARAQRRFKELQAKGENVTYATVLADIKERDERDEKRSIAPAKPAPDAVLIDTTELTADQAFAKALEIAEPKLANTSGTQG